MFFEYDVWIKSTISIIQGIDKMHSALITTGENVYNFRKHVQNFFAVFLAINYSSASIHFFLAFLNLRHFLKIEKKNLFN